MKVLMLNGSSNQKGCTYTALNEAGKILQSEGIEYEIWQIGDDGVKDCTGCGGCAVGNGCVFDDNDVNGFVAKAAEADGFIFGSPVYYAHPSGRLMSFLDRAFYSGSSNFFGKPGFALTSARRAGTTASLDAISKYFGITYMPVASSTYWTMVHGTCPEDVMQDAEGLQTVRNAARNLVRLMKALDGVPMPELERNNRTNFIR